jgi:hypothetical protein
MLHQTVAAVNRCWAGLCWAGSMKPLTTHRIMTTPHRYTNANKISSSPIWNRVAMLHSSVSHEGICPPSPSHSALSYLTNARHRQGCVVLVLPHRRGDIGPDACHLPVSFIQPCSLPVQHCRIDMYRCVGYHVAMDLCRVFPSLFASCLSHLG